MRGSPSRLSLVLLEATAITLFIWIGIEDQARKFLGNPLVLYGVKDLIIAAGVLLAVGSGRLSFTRILPTPLRDVLVWGLVLYALGALNPRLPSLLVAANGIHMTFFAVPTIFIGACLAARESAVVRTAGTLLGVGALVAISGIVQAFVDPGFLNPVPEGDLAGALIRINRAGVEYVTGTYLSPGRYVAFLLSAVGAGTALIVRPGGARSGRPLIAGAVALCVFGVLASGARIALVAVPVVAAGTIALAVLHDRRPAGRQRGRTLLRFVAVGGLTVVLATAAIPRLGSVVEFYRESLFAEQGAGFRERADVNFRFQRYDGWTWLVGNGTGTASLGIAYVTDKLEPGEREGGFPFIVWELGILGLLFYLILAFLLTRLFVAWRPEHGRLAGAFSLGVGPIVAFDLWLLNIVGPVLQSYTAAVPIWFFAGVVLGLQANASKPPPA